jgi:acetylornithine/N-succinyldiaminopimelate aminotransferase
MNTKDLYARFLSNVAQTSDSPMGLVVESANGSNVRAGGKDYIDLLAGMGVMALGHNNPKVKQAIIEQVERYLHVMVYGEFVLERQVELASRLCDLLPAQLESAYFTNSGAEAIEGALKLARKATGRGKLLSFNGSFHGDTLGALSMGGNPIYRDPFGPLLPGIRFADFNDPRAVEEITGEVAAVLIEPIQAEGGVILPKPGFLEALRARCTETGTLLIYDEVVTAFGRTGKLFAFEHHDDAVPDILVLAKALGGGLPLGAFISSRKTMAAFSHDPPLGHVTTFGGNPVCCAAAVASLDEILDHDLPAAAERKGRDFAAALRRRLDHPQLIEVRQIGLLVGINFAEPRTAERFTKACRREGLIVGWTLHDDTVVRLAPPLTISAAELDEASLRMERALARILGLGL